MVPVDEATESTAHKLIELGRLPDCITVDTLRSWLWLCLEETEFANPDGRLYRQVDAVAVGSALGPNLASLFMTQVKDQIAEGLPFYFR